MNELNIYYAKYLAKPNETILEHVNKLMVNIELLEALEYLDEDSIRLLKIAAYYHDAGKLNEWFQKRVNPNEKFYKKFDALKEYTHNVLSIYLINFDAIELKDEMEKAYVAYSILNHHYYVNNLEALIKLDGSEWLDTLIMDVDKKKISARLRGRIKRLSENYQANFLLGLLNLCDYAASAHLPVDYKNDFLEDSLQNLIESWKSIDIKADWRAVQSFCHQHKEESLLIVAQTGMGKTEAALRWIGNTKAYFILPLKTAINAIYLRVIEMIPEQQRQPNTQVSLLHGDMLSFWMMNTAFNLDVNVPEMDYLSYREQSKRLMLPLNIATPDQLFDFVFRVNGYQSKMASLAYSKIVIDEIQTYSPDLLALIIFGLNVLHALGSRILIMTATLPPFMKDLLEREYYLENKEGKKQEYCMKFRSAEFVDNQVRHNLLTIDDFLEADYVLNKYWENENNRIISNKILVVCNTVSKAQKIYEDIKKELSPEEEHRVRLFHSRFIRSDRLSLENEILHDGKSSVDKSVIWICTQVVEASLDLDFDFLITELSDLSALMQRLGRCNRKGLKKTTEPNCFVFLKANPKLLLSAASNGQGFINHEIYSLSVEALQNVNGVISEKEKLQLINYYLTTEKLNEKGQGQSYYLSEYRRSYNYVAEAFANQFSDEIMNIKFRKITSITVIPECEFENVKKLEYELHQLQSCIKSENDNNKKQILYLRWAELKESIYQKTVSVAPYYVKDDKHKFNAKCGEIQITRHESIPIVKCNYSKVLGFSGLNSEQKLELKGKLSTSDISESKSGLDHFL